MLIDLLGAIVYSIAVAFGIIVGGSLAVLFIIFLINTIEDFINDRR